MGKKGKKGKAASASGVRRGALTGPAGFTRTRTRRVEFGFGDLDRLEGRIRAERRAERERERRRGG